MALKGKNITIILCIITVFLYSLLKYGYNGRDLYTYRDYSESLDNYIDRYPDYESSAITAHKQGWPSFYKDWSTYWHVKEDQLQQDIERMDSFITKDLYTKGLPYTTTAKGRETVFAGVFKSLWEWDEPYLGNIAEAFLWFKEKNNLTDRQMALLVINYVQNIPYEIPERPFGLASPIEVLTRNYGDCDSKSLLAFVILSRLGYECVIYTSFFYKHAMLGINLPSTGYYKTWKMTNYYFVEMTTPGWDIGEISKQTQDLDLWDIINLQATY
ncbi:hypothetical protein [Spirochaeta cellobiosiphila]|uniref:hypothetical protein n=1 Tax=Spirochaeta cellobiosiphila TaxID=504483 RepID=UPI000426817C|nr:hypothetical protein [Spirochaeta cellobiosiphila]